MKKSVTLVSLILVFSMAFAMTGCGSAKEMSVSEVSGRLLKEIAYQDDLSKVDLDTAAMFLNLADIDIKEAAIYETSGWTAEEIVVIEGATSADADKARAMLETRLEEQKNNYVDYVPEEMDKLYAAVLVESGNFAILSVSNEPDKAKSIIAEYK